MKKRFREVVVFSLTIFMLFGNKVYANSYNTSLTTNSGSTLKNGDIIEIQAGISWVADGYFVNSQKFTIIYDNNVFEIVNFGKDNYYKLRNGWKSKGGGGGSGQFTIEMFASSVDDYIGADAASDNCLDSINADLVTIELKVKNVSNQNTKVQAINEHSYVEELEFTIHNDSDNNYLASLNVDNYELDNKFNKNKTEYEVIVPFDVEKVNVTATPEDNLALVSGTGEKQLSVGYNKVDLVVTAENGEKKTYTVNVVRNKANDDTSLSKVLVRDSNKKDISLTYDKKTKTYIGEVSAEITFVSFDIKCSGEDCFVEELNSESIQEGKNEFKFMVISQNGDKEEYKIIINKAVSKKDNLILYLSIALAISIIMSVTFLILYLKKKNK